MKSKKNKQVVKCSKLLINNSLNLNRGRIRGRFYICKAVPELDSKILKNSVFFATYTKTKILKLAKFQDFTVFYI